MAEQALTARDIALRLDLKKHPRSWRGECPSCSYARAFSLRAGQDGMPLLRCINGCGREDLEKAVERVAGGELRPRPAKDEQHAAATRQQRMQRALGEWNGALPLDRPQAAPTLTYLAARGIAAIGAPADLRYRADCTHPEERGRWSAMVALVRNVAGEPTGIHKTYLADGGARKAAITPDKATKGLIWGGAVRLTGEKIKGATCADIPWVDLSAQVAPKGGKVRQAGAPWGERVSKLDTPLISANCGNKLVIGEGIESSAAAGILLGLPAWAAIFAGNLAAGLVLPPEVRHVVIAADHDLPTKDGRRPGQEAAQAAARRWRAEGRTVQIALPREPGTDFNDVLMRGDADAA